MNKIALVLIASFITCTEIYASDLFAEVGLHSGGDKFLTAGPSESLKAGGLISGAIGVVSSLNSDLTLRASIGLKFDTITASDGDAIFTRLPLSAMLFTNFEKLNFGLGLSYHLSPTLDVNTSTNLGSFEVNFDNAIGLLAELDYQLGQRGYIGLKMTAIDYELNTTSGTIVTDGNSIGVVLGARF